MVVEVAIVLSYLFGGTLIYRATREHHLGQYAFFHSYLIYFMATGVLGRIDDIWIHSYFALFFWLRFFTLVIAEFALLIQIGDRVIASNPQLPRLARWLTLGITAGFALFYILPPLLNTRPSEVAVFDLVLRSALAKGVVILLLVVLAGYFHVALGRNIMAMTAGLMCYLMINVANFALVERLGWENYGKAFATLGPLSQALMVLIWLVGLWSYEALPVPSQPAFAGGHEALPSRIVRYNTTLDRLFRR